MWLFAEDWFIAFCCIVLPRMLERLGYYEMKWRSASRLGRWVNTLVGVHFFAIPILGLLHIWQFRIWVDGTLALVMAVAVYNTVTLSRSRRR